MELRLIIVMWVIVFPVVLFIVISIGNRRDREKAEREEADGSIYENVAIGPTEKLRSYNKILEQIVEIDDPFIYTDGSYGYPNDVQMCQFCREGYGKHYQWCIWTGSKELLKKEQPHE